MNIYTNAKTLLYLAIVAFTCCCQPTADPIDAVDKLLSTINKPDRELDTSIIQAAPYLKHLFFKYLSVKTSDWEFSSQEKDNGNFVVNVSAKASTTEGNESDYVQEFEVSNGCINNTRNFFILRNNYEVINEQWEILWDLEKIQICENIQRNVKMTPISITTPSMFRDTKKGVVRIVNNSNYDVKNLELQIEHFDSKGNPIKTDSEFTSGILRKSGTQLVKWYTMECDECVSQKFKIIFNQNEQ